MIINEQGNSAAPVNMTYAAGYPDLGGLYQSLDEKGWHKILHCKTVIGDSIKGRANLLPDLGACNKPVVFNVMDGRPTIKPYVINGGPVTADILSYSQLTYNLGGLEYIATKTDELDMACKPQGYEGQIEEARMRALAEKYDKDVSCTLGSFAHPCNLGADIDGMTLGTFDAPVHLTNRLTNAPTGSTYVLDYLEMGVDRIRNQRIRGTIHSMIPYRLMTYAKKAETFRDAGLNGKGSSYLDGAGFGFCDEMLSMSCGHKVHSHDCLLLVGMTDDATPKPIYQVLWFAEDYVDFKHGTVKRYRNDRIHGTSTQIDWQVTRSGMAVSHSEAIAVGYVTLS